MNQAIRQETSSLLRRYLDRFPEESTSFFRLQTQLLSGEDLFVRSNMSGHVTSSVVVLNEERDQILLIGHKFLRKWLPPGGHYEDPGSIWESGMREVAEETGLTGLELHPWCATHGIPLDIDTHAVPENPKKGEGPHFHHDFRYVAIARHVGELVPQEQEVDGVRWATFEELALMDDRRLTQLVKKLEILQLAAVA